MSRTVRRKNAYWNPYDFYPDWWFHSDKVRGIPKDFKTIYCRRPFRRKEKEAIIKALKGDCNPVMPVPKKNAGYYWW